MEIKLNNYV